MSSDGSPQIRGLVNSQDLSVSWISESGMGGGNTDRVSILTMANGQIRLTMQSATINMKGMRLTKGHICILSLFEPSGSAEAADRASELFMNMIMRYDITKRPAEDVLKKCLSKVDKKISKEFKDQGYKASIAAFAAKDLTVCTAGGKIFTVSEDGKVSKITSETTAILPIGRQWKNVLMVSGGYPIAGSDVKEVLRSSTEDLTVKMGQLPGASSLIRVKRN
jgi:hypothetical protein